jgi:squalene-hopene/tetraprenyl-beta-curcumene cyclase
MGTVLWLGVAGGLLLVPIVEPARPTPSKADEPWANRYDPVRAAAYLDSVAVHWTRERQCVSCHTNMLYLAARAPLGGEDQSWREVRTFLEKQVQSWSEGGKPRGDTYVVVTAFALSLHDAFTTGKLQPSTRAALDRMWQHQRPSGEWNWLKCDWPPLEHDDYYGAVLAAVAVGYAPDRYATTPQAQQGLARLRQYLQKTPPPDLHHAAMLLWASVRLPDLLNAEQRRQIIADLKSRQQRDGGWSLPSLGSYKRKDGTPNDPQVPSDGYATGMVTFILLQAGLPPQDPALAKAHQWLLQHQRQSGRYFTRSLNNDKAHYITNIGTAFCALALQHFSNAR